MARSVTGGTKGYLRGSVGDYTYQIRSGGEDGRTQVILSRSRSRVNPNTKYQALSRMQIALMQRAMQVCLPIVADSWQGIPSGITSIDTFVSVNMPLIVKYCKEKWDDASGYLFPEKGDPSNSAGPFIISSGSYRLPSAFSLTFGRFPTYYPSFRFYLPHTNARLYDLRRMWGLSYYDTINLLCLADELGLNSCGLIVVQLTFNRQFGDYRVITPSNVGRIFNVRFLTNGFRDSISVKANASFDLDESANSVIVELQPDFSNSYGIFPLQCLFSTCLVSQRKGNRYYHNAAAFQPAVYGDDDEPFFRAPFDAFYSWWPSYDGESYNELFGRNK